MIPELWLKSVKARFKYAWRYAKFGWLHPGLFSCNDAIKDFLFFQLTDFVDRGGLVLTSWNTNKEKKARVEVQALYRKITESPLNGGAAQDIMVRILNIKRYLWNT